MVEELEIERLKREIELLEDSRNEAVYVVHQLIEGAGPEVVPKWILCQMEA